MPPRVPSAMLQKWRSRSLVGQNKHQCVVRVRRGHIQHGYLDTRRLDHLGPDGLGSPIFPPLIWNGNNHHCWKGQWVVDDEDWLTLPNVESANWSKSFADKGTSTATVVMDNIAFTDVTGVAGLYHTINRGFYSPMKGVRVLSRPKLWPTNSFANVLIGGYQIDIWEGYGPDGSEEVAPGGSLVKRTFVGIIEDCELESHPDKITITARDFNVLFTDQRLMGWNIAREMRSPITFADRRQTQGEVKEFGVPSASSGSFKLTSKQGITWTGRARDDRSDLQWVEMRLPMGHYEDIFLAPGYDGQEIWFALNVKGDSWYNDAHHLPEGWVDLGKGNVPGTDVPFIRHLGSVSDWPRRWSLGQSRGYDFKDGSILRLYFRHLPKVHGLPNDTPYAAHVNALYAFRFGHNPNKFPGAKVNAKHWILVEDAADVVRMLLIWAGFPEWNVEDFGWSLAHQVQVGEDKFFMDVINDLLQQGNFVYYMGMPNSTQDMSIGVPHFEQQKATSRPLNTMLEVRENDLLEAATVKWDLSNLPYVIRYRGEIAKKKKGGAPLFQDLTRRYMGTYFPPWSKAHYFRLGALGTGDLFGRGKALDRVAGVRRHFSQTIGNGATAGLQSNAECIFACVLAAVQYCLQMVTGEIQIAGLPAFELNDHVSIVEGADGINSRMWIVSIESDHTLGPQGKWTMKLGGSYIDIQDMYMIAADYLYAYRKLIEHRPPSREFHPAPIPDPGVVDIADLGAGRI